MEIRPRKRVFFLKQKLPNTLSGGSVASLGISEGKITRRENK